MDHADHANILTFDIEDWFHMIGVRGLDDPFVWSTLPGIVERETMGILSLLDCHAVRATFFVVGWIAEQYPALIRRIAEAGHELASHSHLHRTVFSMTPAMFREDLRRSVCAIEQAADVRVLGYRAPSFSIVPGCEWALEIIAEQGLVYDASFFPVPRANGGYPCAQSPHKLALVSGANLAEVPMTTMSLLGYRSAFSGGGYFRLLPEVLIDRGFAQADEANIPVVVYLHPRDFTRDWPLARLPVGRRTSAWIGCPATSVKLEGLLRRHQFTSCHDYLVRRGLCPAEYGPTSDPPSLLPSSVR